MNLFSFIENIYTHAEIVYRMNTTIAKYFRSPKRRKRLFNHCTMGCFVRNWFSNLNFSFSYSFLAYYAFCCTTLRIVDREFITCVIGSIHIFFLREINTIDFPMINCNSSSSCDVQVSIFWPNIFFPKNADEITKKLLLNGSSPCGISWRGMKE